METSNNTPKETAPASTPAPDATPAPVAAAAPAAVPAANTPKAPAAQAAPAPAPAPQGVVPTTDGKTVGGWNRFAGYNPNDAKNRKNDRRDGRGRR